MRDRASLTAAWVAASRTLGRTLPAATRLVDDPYGAIFAGGALGLVARQVPRVLAWPMWPFALYMQVRTRVIDDALHDFVAAGGRQVVILGAGYDCRAARFDAELGDTRVFEIDHPATQAHKRDVLDAAGAATSRVAYVPWNFERNDVAELPGALAALGHDASRPTLTIWEGVTMYLSEGAIDATVGAVRAYSAADSPFVLTYVERRTIERPNPVTALGARAVALLGEPFRFGWQPAELPTWFAPRGFTVESDREMAECARALLPAGYARLVRVPDRVALLRRR